MKKSLLLCLIFLMVSCSSSSSSPHFDADYEILVNNIHNSDFLESSLTPIDDTDTYEIEYLKLKMRAYYQELKEKFTYVFVLTIAGNETPIKEIRSFVALENENEKMSIAQIGFDGVKKTIEANKNNTSYKGLQFFVTPYIANSSKVHFYFECENFVGHYYTFSSLKEFKV